MSSWRDYLIDGIQLLALVSTVSVILYCVDALLSYYVIVK